MNNQEVYNNFLKENNWQSIPVSYEEFLKKFFDISTFGCTDEFLNSVLELIDFETERKLNELTRNQKNLKDFLYKNRKKFPSWDVIYKAFKFKKRNGN
jgi:hypothetical protein